MNITECSSYVYLDRKINMLNEFALGWSRSERAVWEAFKGIEDVVKRTKNTPLGAHLFDSTVLFALTYESRQKPGRCVSRMKGHSVLLNAQQKGRC
ncbi:unnamed protein product [Angiostrongylus costaricensis]|uniref:PRELI/MSF1 domain-containing protein n=1 Tax=Angiostrongylus costaricensis TaxID=334426 RepID=A0A0R3PVL1_ANGCS|nr:unnamed protein product [Angiostrongylus costaricensis]